MGFPYDPVFWFHLHQIEMYNSRNWVPQREWEPNKQQFKTVCFSASQRTICDPVMTIGEKGTIYETPSVPDIG